MRDIRNIVDKCIKKYGTANPFEICDAMNIKVIRQDLPQTVNGFFVKFCKTYVITLNENCPREKEKFVLAHELGHIIIHGGTNSFAIRCNTNLCVNRLEHQADYFAGYLLLRDNDLSGLFSDIQVTTERISMLTGVPEDVLRIML